jgi:hypothetical protein
MKRNMQLRQDVASATIGILVGLLIFSCIAIFWEAQIIAKQEAIIRMQLEGGSR